MKDIPGFEGLYKISRNGSVYGKKRNGWLSPVKDKGGYIRVPLCKDGETRMYSVHRLVAQIFIPNPDKKPQVNHKNGVKTDNRVENLEWCTQLENMRHAKENGLRPQGEESWCAKLSDKKVLEMRALYEPKSSRTRGMGFKRLAERFGVSRRTAIMAITGRTWKHLR